jgi:hypothetical protein
VPRFCAARFVTFFSSNDIFTKNEVSLLLPVHRHAQVDHLLRSAYRGVYPVLLPMATKETITSPLHYPLFSDSSPISYSPGDARLGLNGGGQWGGDMSEGEATVESVHTAVFRQSHTLIPGLRGEESGRMESNGRMDLRLVMAHVPEDGTRDV